MSHGDPADLCVAPGAGDGAPGAADHLQRLRQRPGRHQRLRRHDKDHGDDQGNAHGHGEERGQMPGLGRAQRPAQDLGRGEAKQASQQRPSGADRQPEQPPRCPGQGGH